MPPKKIAKKESTVSQPNPPVSTVSNTDIFSNAFTPKNKLTQSRNSSFSSFSSRSSYSYSTSVSNFSFKTSNLDLINYGNCGSPLPSQNSRFPSQNSNYRGQDLSSRLSQKSNFNLPLSVGNGQVTGKNSPFSSSFSSLSHGSFGSRSNSKYHILDQLGHGAFGTVYKAQISKSWLRVNKTASKLNFGQKRVRHESNESRDSNLSTTASAAKRSKTNVGSTAADVMSTSTHSGNDFQLGSPIFENEDSNDSLAIEPRRNSALPESKNVDPKHRLIRAIKKVPCNAPENVELALHEFWVLSALRVGWILLLEKK